MAVTKVSDADFNEQLTNHDKVIVKYYADWCGSCRLIAPKYKRLANDARFDDVTFLDVNAEENQGARQAAGVSNLPFFATFRNGQLVRADAVGKEEKVVEMITELQKG